MSKVTKETKVEKDEIIEVTIHGEKMQWNKTKWGAPPLEKPLTPRNKAHAEVDQ